jgi:Ca2+-binding RTX toxin-like protein
MGTWTPGPGPTEGDDTYAADAAGGAAVAGGGNDTFLATGGYAAGVNVFDGGAGVDQVNWFFDPVVSGLTLSLSVTSPQLVGTGSYQFISIENLGGSAGIDTLTGDLGNNTLWGYGGDDILYGVSGDDTLFGWGGNDRLFGGDGNDQLFGNEGDDELVGGLGYDTAVFAGNASTYTVVTEFDAVTNSYVTRVSSTLYGSDTVTGIEHLQFDDAFINLPPTTSPSYWTLSSLSFNRSTEFASTPGWQSVFPNNTQIFDINNDGALDVVLLYSHIPPLNDGGIPIRVLLGDGQGGFSDGTALLFGANVPLSDAQTGVHTNDFNGDGRLDLFISQHGFDAPPFPGIQNQLILSSGLTAVINATASLPQTSDFTHWSSSADIDGDGDIDIYVGNLGNDSIHITSPYFLINDGSGGFTRSDTQLPASLDDGFTQLFHSSLFVDADNDGDPDLLLGAYGDANSPTSLLLFNDGSGNFSLTASSALPPSVYDPQLVQVLGMGATDLNGDGFQDLLLLTSWLSEAPDRYIQVLINQGDGSFVDETAARLNAFDTSIGREFFLEDLNGDGFTDLLLQTGGDTRFFLNDGSGRFVALPANFLSPSTLGFTPGDFNGDGHLDFFGTGQVSSFPGSSVESHYVALWTPWPSTTQNGDGDANAFLGDDRTEVLNGLGGDDVIFGGAGNDSLNGGAGADYLNGGVGTDNASYVDAAAGVTASLSAPASNNGEATGDTYYSVENLTGTSFDDTLGGDADANVLDGGSGADTMAGGNGNDGYIVDNAADTVTELSGEGIDTVQASISYVIGTNVENLVLTGSAIGGTGNSLANTIVGNGLANALVGNDGADILEGGAGNDTLDGGNHDDQLFGGDNADTLYGRAGNDTLDGGAGSNTLEGGGGDDTYYVRGASDVVVELSASGTDLLISTATRTLGNFLENLTLTGASAINGFGNILANTMIGNDAANTLNGLAGADTLSGNGGTDTLNGGDGTDTLNGGADNDVLDGGNNDDTLNGGDGADTLYGRTQNDILNGEAGNDTIFGGDGDDVATGGDGDDLIDGLNNNDTLSGGDGADDLYGRQNNDVLNGDAGNDDLYGGDGDDQINGGADDDLLDGGNGIDVLNGGDGADTLYGRNGVDTLDGGLGADTLSGGNDADTFVFSTALGASNIDTIQFYSVAQDTIQLDVDVFSAIGLGTLAANVFVIGAAATTADHRIIYDATTGALYYDADGNGAGAAVQFATLGTGLALTNADFVGGP